MNTTNASTSNPGFTTRRDWLKTVGLGGGALLGGGVFRAAAAVGSAESTATAGRSLRLAHITDIHVQPELRAGDGFIQCLRHIQSQKDAPGLVLNTGDCIMDSMEADQARTKLQWKLWNDILRGECSIPVEHTIGNHDCWGINQTKTGTTGNEPLWGKKWAMDSLGLSKPYRSFDRNGWHFIVLDSVEPYQDSYRARLGEEQLAWLKQDLAAVPKRTPVIVASHIPIVSPGAVLNDAKENAGHDLNVSGGLMHLDSKEIHALFREQGNVKLCLSGHLHIIDRAEYDGVTYISSGAVSSGWWKAIRLGRFDYGYALVDLFNDGSFKYQYATYGWKTAGATSEVVPKPYDDKKGS